MNETLRAFLLFFGGEFGKKFYAFGDIGPDGAFIGEAAFLGRDKGLGNFCLKSRFESLRPDRI